MKLFNRNYINFFKKGQRWNALTSNSTPKICDNLSKRSTQDYIVYNEEEIKVLLF